MSVEPAAAVERESVELMDAGQLVAVFGALATVPCAGGAEFLFGEIRRLGLASPMPLGPAIAASVALVMRGVGIDGVEAIAC